MSGNIVYMAKTKWVELLDMIREKSGSSDLMTVTGAIDTVRQINAGGFTADDIAESIRIDGDIVCNNTNVIYPGSFASTNITSFTSNTINNAYPIANNWGTFKNCSNLKTIDMPAVNSNLPDGFADGCVNLERFNIPKAIIPNGSAFFNCRKLKNVVLNNTHLTGNTTFQNCTLLEAVDLGNSELRIAGALGTATFANCQNLRTIVLRKPVLYTLSSTNVFNQTPYANGGTGGNIFVPEALIETYKTAGNWSTIFGYGSTTFRPIEGSYYELYHVDGSLVN